MSDIRQSKQYADYLSKIGWIVERINDTSYFIKKFPIFGSVLKIQRPKTIDFEVIERSRKKYRAFQIIIEPKNKTQTQGILNNGYKQSKSSYLPTKTLHLDLDISKQKLFISLKKDAKYALRKNKDVGFKIYDLSNIKEFRRIWKKAVGWKRYVPPLKNLQALKKAFGENSLFIIDCDKTAGAIFLAAGKTGYYWQAFTGKKGRKSRVQYGIVWNGILWAKKKGAKILDFEGIYDERFPNKSWLGFSHFKKSFGGYEVTYPGAFVKTRLIW